MSDDTYNVAECPKHGSYIASPDGCPRCSQKPFSNVVSVSSIGQCASTPEKSQKRRKTPSKQKQRLSESQTEQSYIMPIALPKGKERSQKWLYQGEVFDSTPEKNRMLYLEGLQDQGIISGLRPHPKYPVNPAVIVPANDIAPEFEIPEELYTADFCYRYNGYFIVEDVKAPRQTKVRRTLKARVETASKLKYRQLDRQMATRKKQVFLLTVWHGRQWHYFNSNQTEIEFSLEQVEDKVA